jgi:hypothetical protein
MTLRYVRSLLIGSDLSIVGQFFGSRFRRGAQDSDLLVPKLPSVQT